MSLNIETEPTTYPNIQTTNRNNSNNNNNNDEIVSSNCSLDQNPFLTSFPSSSYPDSCLLSSALTVCKNEKLNGEEVELLLNPPCQLTLSLEELISPADKTSKLSFKYRKKRLSTIASSPTTTDVNLTSTTTDTIAIVDTKIPRPQNAWILYRKNYQRLRSPRSSESYLNMRNVSSDAKERWKNESEEVKRFFGILSKLAHEKHKSIYPHYKYTPKKKTTKDNNSKAWVFREFVQQKQRQKQKKISENVNNVDRISLPSSPCSSPPSSSSITMPLFHNINFNYFVNDEFYPGHSQSTTVLNGHSNPNPNSNPNTQKSSDNNNSNNTDFNIKKFIQPKSGLEFNNNLNFISFDDISYQSIINNTNNTENDFNGEEIPEITNNSNSNSNRVRSSSY